MSRKLFRVSAYIIGIIYKNTTYTNRITGLGYEEDGKILGGFIELNFNEI